MKEWQVQLGALILLFLNSVIYVEHEGVTLSNSLGVDVLFFLYHVMLFILVANLLLPTFFYTRKFFQFFLYLFVSIVLFGIIEEGIVEKLLTPNSRGRNDITWQSIYWFFEEIFLPLLSFVSVKLVFDNFAQKQKLKEIEQNRLVNELKLLKSQIQPHILFNSLNNLYHFALQKSEEVPDLILKLSNVLRYVTYGAHEEIVSLEKELSFIQDYVHLQNIQYKGRGNIAFECKMESSMKEYTIAPFLLIPFIENSFKHSFGTQIKDVFVNIKIRIKQKKFSLKIENSYEEVSKDDLSLVEGGIGLENVKKRLKLLYPQKHELSIKTGEGLYSVFLSLKLNEWKY